MQTDIKATNMELTEAIRAFVQEKMDGLDAKTKRFGDVVRAEVEVGMTGKHHKSGEIFRAEVHVRLPGKVVYAEATHEDLYTAFGNAKKEAERQIDTYKGTLEAGQKKGGRKARGK
jgi:ribosomal subunit interface protein